MTTPLIIDPANAPLDTFVLPMDHYGLLTSYNLTNVIDGPDSDAFPDLLSSTGTISLVPSIPVLNITGSDHPEAASISLTTLTVTVGVDGRLYTPLEDGTVLLGAYLIANTLLCGDVTNWTYKVVFNLSAGGRFTPRPSFHIRVTAGEVTDLARVAPVQSSPGIQIIQGPVGAKGENGGAGRDGTSLVIRGTVADSASLPVADNRTGDSYLTLDEQRLWSFDGTTFVDGGILGKEGPRGANGSSVHVRGTVADQSELPVAGTTPDGDAYVDASTGHLWVDAGDQWTDVGPFKGQDGARGEQGLKGDRGSSMLLRGRVADSSLLPTVATEGDVYFTEDNHIWSFDGVAWVNGGSLEGPQGIPGLQGNPGGVGPAPVITAGTATALPAGSAPTVSVTGNNPYAINIGVPDGPAGAAATVRDSGWWKTNQTWAGNSGYKAIVRRVGNEVFWQVQPSINANGTQYTMASTGYSNPPFIRPTKSLTIEAYSMGTHTNAAVTDPAIKYRFVTVWTTTAVNGDWSMYLALRHPDPATGSGFRYNGAWVAFSYLTDDPFPADNNIMGPLSVIYSPGNNP